MTFTQDDLNFFSNFTAATLNTLHALGCGIGWRVEYVQTLPDRPRSRALCDLKGKRMTFTFWLFDEYDAAQIRDVWLHELGHAVLESKKRLAEGVDPHGAAFQMVFDDLKRRYCSQFPSLDGFKLMSQRSAS